MEHKDADIEEFLSSINSSKDTPLRQIFDRHLAKNNLLNSHAQDAVKISESQLRKLLNGQSGTKERPAEQLRQFLSVPEEHWTFVFDVAKSRVRTHEDFVILRDRALVPSNETAVTPTSATNSLDKKRAVLLVALIACGALVFTFARNGNKAPPLASIPPDRPCTIDLRGETAKMITCDEFGTFKVSGTSRSDWHTKASIVRIPSGWDVVSRHETWGEPNYSVLVEEESGFVHLPTGDNYLGRSMFDVYNSVDLDDMPRKSRDRELNDRLQYLVIRDVGLDPIVIWEHDHLAHPHQLTIAHSP